MKNEKSTPDKGPEGFGESGTMAPDIAQGRGNPLFCS
jgi:hypothetical protein